MRWHYDDTIFSFLNFILGIITLLLGLRILFKLVEANPATPFVSWLYGLSSVLIAPFAGIFPNQAVNGAVLDLVAMVALVMYAIGFYALSALIEAIMVRSGYRHPVEI